MAVDWLALYLEEDVGPGDATTKALFTTEPGAARIVAREAAVVAGLPHAAEVLRRCGAAVDPLVKDGVQVAAGTTVARVFGPAAAILTGERLALNLLARMSGIASLTRELMQLLATACAPAIVAGTRKTTPGFRHFEKEAIRIGGGDPHRMGLWDACMVKDNHIAAAGSVRSAVERVKQANPGILVECEVESLAHAQEAAQAGADWILIDNQPAEVGKAWAMDLWDKHPRIKVEASGGITPTTLVAYGWADRISLGWLTQKAPAKDFGLDWEDNA